MIKKILKFIIGKKVSFFCEIILLLAPTYFLIVKKGLGLSLSEGLKSVFLPWVAEIIIWTLYAVIFLAVACKLIILACEKFNIVERKIIQPDGIKELCLRLNVEIEEHISKHENKTRQEWIGEIKPHHEFKTNIALTITQMTDHLASSLGIAQKRRDIFVSLYCVEKFDAGIFLSQFDNKTETFINTPSSTIQLDYLTHWDPSSSHKYSRYIDVGSESFKSYECVKAHKEGRTFHVKADSKDYYCSPTNKRAKNTENFLCFFITINDKVVGLLNIEFHNNKVFNSDEEMIDYVESDLMPYMFMIQYQFLKKRLLQLL